MPSLPQIRTSISSLPQGRPLVAALTGGTTGIGSYIAHALASTYASSGAQLRVYIVGRNSARAATVIAECEARAPGSEWRFVQATDLALISEVDRCCAEIVRLEREGGRQGEEARLDLLYMSHCYPILKERSTTEEGLDAFLSTTYYSRMRFILQLLPLLTASALPAHVISVYAGGMEDGTKASDPLPIGCPPDSAYGIGGVRKYTCFMKTFFFEELAARHAGKLSLTHIYPGLVDGPTFLSPEMPTWFRWTWWVMKPLVGWYMTAPEDCGQVMLYLATDAFPAKGTATKTAKGEDVGKSTLREVGGGSYAVGQRGDVNNDCAYEKVRKEDTSKLVWEHTMEVLDGIDKRNASVK